MAQQRLAIVTGGMGGLGETISTKMVDAGYQVVVTYSPSNTKWKEWLDGMKARGYHFAAYPVDVTSYEDCAAKCERIRREIGPVDILVNNAGITRDTLALRMSTADWDAVIDTNLKGAFLCMQQAMAGMVKARWGRIINIASVVGQMGNAGQANYSAAKAGLIGMTKAIAQELASRNITANCIAPGFIDTDMTAVLAGDLRERLLNSIPLKRFGTPEDIAAAVRFLASEEAGYITGATLNVNGGMYM